VQGLWPPRGIAPVISYRYSLLGAHRHNWEGWKPAAAGRSRRARYSSAVSSPPTPSARGSPTKEHTRSQSSRYATGNQAAGWRLAAMGGGCSPQLWAVSVLDLQNLH